VPEELFPEWNHPPASEKQIHYEQGDWSIFQKTDELVKVFIVYIKKNDNFYINQMHPPKRDRTQTP
jgi:hypothetical protein